MLDQLKIEHILFLDIETVPLYPSYEKLPGPIRALWDKKASYLKKEAETPAELYFRAGIYAEFGKVICISTGLVYIEEDRMKMRIKSFYGGDEKNILMSFNSLLEKIMLKREIQLCAHNGKEFDFPYIARRMLANGIRLPAILDIAGKRPWEIRHLDTMELWKFGDYKHYTSLDLLAHVFNIPSPKTDIDGSQVASVYWNDKNLMRIVEYCQRDVITIVQLILRYKGMNTISQDDITVVP